MSFTCLLGASAWDASVYVRAKLEDASPGFLISDAALQAYTEAAVEDFSRLLPLEDIIGNPLTATSPMNTVKNQLRYVCSPANGFPVPPILITDVLYRAASTYSAANELAYLSILPFSPINRFLFTPNLLDSPTIRILRNEYLTEVQHYGRGFAGIVLDRATGLLALDLFPSPTVDGIPIFVRYMSAYVNTGTAANPIYATVPEIYKTKFADLLYAEALFQEADRMAKYERSRVGFLDLQGKAAEMRLLAEYTRTRVELALGAAQGIAQVGS